VEQRDGPDDEIEEHALHLFGLVQIHGVHAVHDLRAMPHQAEIVDAGGRFLVAGPHHITHVQGGAPEPAIALFGFV
jgi:hypothetical protein